MYSWRFTSCESLTVAFAGQRAVHHDGRAAASSFLDYFSAPALTRADPHPW